MKKLGKLSISPEKIMKNKELINLQGGMKLTHAYAKKMTAMKKKQFIIVIVERMSQVYVV